MATVPLPSSTPPPSGHLCFLGPLHELVAVGLYRPAFDALLAGADPMSAARPPIDRSYLLKILDEEIARPFGHPLRPVVELVLNAADACRARHEAVDVTADDGRIEVVDRGEGMDLRAILTRLLLPFATDKIPGVDLGRFGVGFFSILGLGLAEPASFSLQIDTGDGVSGWSVRVASSGCDAAALTVSVRRAAPIVGTRVRVASALLDGAQVRSYLRDALHFFPPERAVVRVDGVPINDGSLISGGRLFEDEASPGVVGRFHLGGRGLTPGIAAGTYHQGVKIEACFAIAELALVDFPGAVELTEGRDAIKPGAAHTAVVAAFHRRIARLAEEASAGPSARRRIAELAAQISALMLYSAAWAEVAPELARALLGPGSCLLGPDRAEVVLGFLGPGAADRVFVPESFWAEREWHAALPGERELLEDELILDPIEALSTLVRRRPDLAGLPVLASRAQDPSTIAVALVHGRRRPAGPLPCLATRRAVLVHADAPAVRAPRGWADVYALRTSFDRALGLRETDVERDLIVSAPIGAAQARAFG